MKKMKQYHKLFIKVIDRSKKSFIDAEGNERVHVKWIEVPSADLGSLKNPNKDIIEFKLEPIQDANSRQGLWFGKF